MYLLPGYIKYREENGNLYVSSDLFQNEIEINEKDLIKEFYALVDNGGCQHLSTSLENFLYEQELLQKEIEIKESLEEAKKILEDDLFLTIMPTEGCNFRCTYCYESHNNINMTKEMLAHIRNYIVEQAVTSKNINISWFGGEPTLCKNIILEMSSFVQKLQEKHKFKYRANMTTNGYFLDCKSFHQYYKAGINEYQITLDGWNHDLTRPHVSGKGTLKTILENLKNISLLSQDYEFHVIVRYNILDGDLDFSWYDFLYDQFGLDARFSVLVAPVNDWGGETVKTLNILDGDRKIALRKLHENYLDNIGMGRIGKVKLPFSDVCYASCNRGFIFRANGKVEKCTIALNHPKNQVGVIHSEKGVILDEESCKRWCTSDLKTECLTCKNVLSCLNIACRKVIIVDGRTEKVCLCKTVTDKKETKSKSMCIDC